jgi:hypothetical protein
MFGPFVGCIDSGGGKFRINFSISVILFKKPVRESPRRIHAFQDPFLPDFSGKALFCSNRTWDWMIPHFSVELKIQLSWTKALIRVAEEKYYSPFCKGPCGLLAGINYKEIA